MTKTTATYHHLTTSYAAHAAQSIANVSIDDLGYHYNTVGGLSRRRDCVGGYLQIIVLRQQECTSCVHAYNYLPPSINAIK